MALAVNLGLTFYGIGWGLPARWNVDQEVTEAVKMAAERRWLTYDVYHPPFYKVVVLAALAPYAGYLALRGTSFGALADAASVSWHHFTQVAPDVASGLFLVARGLSAVFGAVMVWFVYRIGLRLMTPVGAVAAAWVLAVTMGFVGDNHLERSSSLINLLGVVVLMVSVAALDQERRSRASCRRLLLTGWFIAGLSCAVKYNGLALVVPIGLATWWCGATPRHLLMSGGCWLLGLLSGWPMLPWSVHHIVTSARGYADFLFGSQEVAPWPIRLLNCIIQVVVIFGVPLAVCVGVGMRTIMARVMRKAPRWREWLTVMLWMAAYLVLAASYRFTVAHTKFLILIVPALALCGGVAIERWVGAGRTTAWWRVAVLVLLFGYSAAYAWSGNWSYAGGDTRYQASRWILDALPADATIEHLQQPSWLFTESLLDERRILFLGERTRDAYRAEMTRGASLSVFDALGQRIDAHADWLAQGLGEARYLAVAFPGAEYDALGRGAWKQFVQQLLRGEAPYRLVARFEPPNVQVTSRYVPGFTYPKHLWWHPVPNDYVSPAILIYERTS